MNRFPHDATTEIIVPLPHRRGVHVVFSRDLTADEWDDVSAVILAKIDQKRAAEGVPAENPASHVAAGGR
jgi:hypothetical protein